MGFIKHQEAGCESSLLLFLCYVKSVFSVYQLITLSSLRR